MSMYFNPSIGLTSVPTFVQGHDAPNIKPFQSLNRAYKRSDAYFNQAWITIHDCFNPSIGLTSVPTNSAGSTITTGMRFQSLNRAYKRSDPR